MRPKQSFGMQGPREVVSAVTRFQVGGGAMATVSNVSWRLTVPESSTAGDKHAGGSTLNAKRPLAPYMERSAGTILRTRRRRMRERKKTEKRW